MRPSLDAAAMARDHALEPRVLLSTIVVSNLRDSGAGSLRSAVADAANGDLIVFAGRLAGHTITLQSEIDVTSNVRIKGPSGRSVTLSGGGTTRVLEIDGGSVSLANLVITRGSADIGGGILESTGRLSLTNVRFTGNVAHGSSTEIAQGGAIAQEGGGLSVNRSTFTRNLVIGDPQSPVALPPPIIDPLPSPILSSTGAIVSLAPTHYGGEAEGGAIADKGGAMAIRSSKFSNNTAAGSLVQTSQYGGDAYGGALFIATGSLKSAGSTFNNNRAIGGNYINNNFTSVAIVAGGASGGAIAADSATLALKNNTIRSNAALGGQAQNAAGASGGGGGGAAGGAIALLETSTLALSGGTIFRNQALGGGGVSPSNAQPAYYPTSGTAAGGGIDAEDEANLSIDKTTLSNNLARGGDMPSPTTSNSYTYAASAWGGAIQFVATGSLTLSKTELLDNSAIGGNAQTPGQAYGGAMDVDGGNAITIVNSVVRSNLAESGQGFGSSANPSSLSFGQASGGGINDGYGSGVFSLMNSQVIANRAIGVDNGVATGGGLAFSDVQVNLVADTLQSNAAIGGPIVTNATFGQGSGGAIAVVGQTMTVTNSKFLDNQATSATLNLRYAQFGSNDASLGGAIANDGATLTISGGKFMGNQAIGGGGPAGGQGANGEGGVIANLANGSLSLSFATVVANQAIATDGGQGLGGGLFLAQNSIGTLNNDVIAGNQATTSGDDIEDLRQ